MKFSTSILKILPFVFASSVEPEIQQKFDPANEIAPFYKCLQDTFYNVNSEEELKTFSNKFANAYFNTMNSPLGDLFSIEYENNDSLSNLITLVHNSASYKNCKNLCPENITGRFLDNFSFNQLKALFRMNNNFLNSKLYSSNSNKHFFPLRSFSDLFIALLYYLAPTSKDIKPISELLAKIEVSIDSIYSLIKENEKLPLDESIVAVLKIKTNSLKDNCAYFNALSEQFIESIPFDKNNASVILNAYNLKNYLATLGTTAYSFVNLYIDAPVASNYLEASRNIFSLFQFIAFFSIKKSGITQFVKEFALPTFKPWGITVFFNSIFCNPTVENSDLAVPREDSNLQSLYTSNFLDQAKNSLEAEETLRSDVTPLVNPTLINSSTNKNINANTVILPGNKVQEPEKIKSENTSTKNTGYYYYLVLSATVLLLFALGFVAYGIYKKNSSNI